MRIRDKSERYKSREGEKELEERGEGRGGGEKEHARAEAGKRERKTRNAKEDKPGESKRRIPPLVHHRYVPVVLSSGSPRVCVWLSLCVSSPRNRPRRRSRRRRLPRRWQRLANSGDAGGGWSNCRHPEGRFERRRQC